MNPVDAAKIITPFLIVALGIGGAKALIASRGQAQKAAPEARVSTVEFVVVGDAPPLARVDSTGVVEGVRQVSLSALVSGEVTWVSEALEPGGRFKSGAPLLRVDPRDYELAVAQERSRVTQAELELQMEKQRQQTAAREWSVLGNGRDAEEAPLALRKPQLEASERALESARSGLRKAELNLERTSLVAPFNAMVLSESVDKGQLLAPGASVVSLVGTDRFRVEVSVPVEQLAYIGIPGVSGASAGSSAIVTQEMGASSVERSGKVIGLAGQLDPQTRTANVFVAIDDPLAGSGLPLLPGAFVSVSIAGLPIDGAVSIPRIGLVGGDAVWVVDDDDTLSRRTVQVAWRDEEQAFLSRGLSPGERLVVTPMSLPIDGAKVKARPAAAPTRAEPSEQPRAGSAEN